MLLTIPSDTQRRIRETKDQVNFLNTYIPLHHHHLTDTSSDRNTPTWSLWTKLPTKPTYIQHKYALHTYIHTYRQPVPGPGRSSRRGASRGRASAGAQWAATSWSAISSSDGRNRQHHHVLGVLVGQPVRQSKINCVRAYAYCKLLTMPSLVCALSPSARNMYARVQEQCNTMHMFCLLTRSATHNA